MSAPSLPLLPLAEAVAAIAPHQRAKPPAMANGRTPVIVHQYWDRDPPAEVLALLRHNARLVQRCGASYRLWTARRAEVFLAARAPDLLPLFKRAPHPAMACDLLRLCLLHAYGGIYLDADMSLRARWAGRGHEVLRWLQDGLVFRWNRKDRGNLLNWCFGFRAGDPLCAALIAATAASMTHALDRDAKAALRNTLTVSGPALFTRVVGTWIAAQGCPPGLVILDARQAYARIQYGHDSIVPLALRREPLAYKATTRHWFRAAQD